MKRLPLFSGSRCKIEKDIVTTFVDCTLPTYKRKELAIRAGSSELFATALRSLALLHRSVAQYLLLHCVGWMWPDEDGVVSLCNRWSDDEFMQIVESATELSAVAGPVECFNFMVIGISVNVPGKTVLALLRKKVEDVSALDLRGSPPVG